MSGRFGLLLFSTNADFITRAVDAGVDGIIVDWENSGKHGRQQHCDTQINSDTIDDLHRVRACTDAPVLCRINGFGPSTRMEIELAMEAGVDEILLPMARTIQEVRSVLEVVAERCGVGILIETTEAVRISCLLGQLPLTRIYVGLNDLAIERATSNIFASVRDGFVESIRRSVHVPFGFGGLTLVDRGFPIPCRLLIDEMTRLECGFSFLRRSFHRDISGRDMSLEISRIREAFRYSGKRGPQAVSESRRNLEDAIDSWPEEHLFVGGVRGYERDCR